MIKKLILLMLVIIPVSLLSAADGAMIPVTSDSQLKEYRKSSSWKQVPCSKCNGTGSTMKVVYGKNNTVTKTQIPCPYCQGRGYVGMSKM